MIFQNSIVAKYLKTQPDYVGARYEAYKAYFFNAERQENIKSSKEEQFQEGFLRELFVKILGYTINPDPSFNLTTEYKNAKDARKADGAILVNGSPVGVIELKDHKTQDLRAIETQAFGYKNNNKGVRYIVISNFEKLRFYVDDAVDCEEFDLFNLNENDFKKLYLCLAYENIISQIPLKLKEESVSEEKSITNALYKDYSVFKRELFKDICEKNVDKADKLTLFRKTQKLLDRLLFIFFAEDRGLIPPNMIAKIIEDVKKLRELDVEVSLYDRFKKYFTYLDQGYKGKDYEVFAYNGGLFKTDELLDSLDIDDNLLALHSQRLSNYDFESDVSVDILGHIFEHSLSEIEEIQNEINGVATDAKTSKRKKDGVFYTPAYITKYIVENTVGALCKNKKDELGLSFDDSTHVIASEAKQSTASRKKRIETLDTYREWLLDLTIVDPACGSGAFLNAAMQFLIAEHKAIDVAKAHIYEKGDAVQMALSDIETQVLEKNIYGVDINDESVEIAKLSLWLHTAQPGRKLNNLNHNIKCGNSLISDPDVAGDKAFDWEKEFPEVFAKGGFDVVIGNPPYGATFSERDISHLLQEYPNQSYQLDSYLLFTEKIKSLAREKAFAGYIMPNTWLSTIFNNEIRKFVFRNYAIKNLNHYSYFVFEDATVETDVYIMSLNSQEAEINNIEVNFISERGLEWTSSLSQQKIIQSEGAPINIYTRSEFDSIKQITNKLNKLGTLCQIVQGTKPFQKGKGLPKQTQEIVDEEPYVKSFKENGSFVPLIRGSLMNRYAINWNNDYWISYGDWLAEPRYSAKFDVKQKLLIRQTGDSIIAAYDDKQFVARDNLYVLRDDEQKLNLKVLMAVLNSRFITWFYRKFINPEEGKTMAQVKKAHLNELPIPDSLLKDDETNDVLYLADTILDLNKSLQQKRNNFLTAIKAEFNFEKTTQTLEKIDEYDFKTFLAELKKVKANVFASQKIEWAGTFTTYKNECNELSQKIADTDHEIDQKVYALYGLTDDEIAIVENG